MAKVIVLVQDEDDAYDLVTEDVLPAIEQVCREVGKYFDYQVTAEARVEDIKAVS